MKKLVSSLLSVICLMICDVQASALGTTVFYEYTPPIKDAILPNTNAESSFNIIGWLLITLAMFLFIICLYKSHRKDGDGK